VISLTDPFMPPGFVPISPHFEYDLGTTVGRLVFDWDGAALGPDSELLLIEKELTRPVVLHIQGHVSRATYMLARGEQIRKLIWIVREPDFQAIWRIVEPWRAALLASCGTPSPPCEYWTPEGVCLAISPTPRNLEPPGTVFEGMNAESAAPIGEQ
jgi:hypothetical protein